MRFCTFSYIFFLGEPCEIRYRRILGEQFSTMRSSICSQCMEIFLYNSKCNMQMFMKKDLYGGFLGHTRIEVLQF